MSIGVPIKVLHEVIINIFFESQRKSYFSLQTFYAIYSRFDVEIYISIIWFSSSLYSSQLFQAEGHIITCETITGEVYRGKLIEAEDNMNCQMQNVTVTARYIQHDANKNTYIDI